MSAEEEKFNIKYYRIINPNNADEWVNVGVNDYVDGCSYEDYVKKGAIVKNKTQLLGK